MDTRSNIQSNTFAQADSNVPAVESADVAHNLSQTEIAAQKLLSDSGYSAPPIPVDDSSSWLRTAATAVGATAGFVATMPGRVGVIGKVVSAGLGALVATDMVFNQDERLQDLEVLGGIAAGFTAGKLRAAGKAQALEAKALPEGRALWAPYTEDGVPSVSGLKYKQTTLVSEIETTNTRPIAKTYEEYKTKSWTFTQPEMRLFENERTGTQMLVPKNPADYDRINLDQIKQLSDRFPDPRLVRRINVSDLPHPDEAWMRSTLDRPTMKISADVKKDGTMTLYRPGTDTNVKVLSNHEWSHLHELQNPEASKLFTDLGKVEANLPPSSAIADIGTKEAWPIYAETFLGDDGVLAAATAIRSPLRASIWSKTFQKTLADVPEELRSPAHDFYTARARLIGEAAGPDVEQALRAMQKSTDSEIRATAEAVRQYLK